MASSLIVMIQPMGCDNSAAQSGALAALRGSEMALALFECHADSSTLLYELCQFFVCQRPQGAILLPQLCAVPGIAELCAELDIALVRLIPGPPDDTTSTLSSHDRQAAADATRYLITLGHQRIGMIAGPDLCHSSRECELGFIDALADHALDRGAELVAPSDGSVTSGEAAARLQLEVSPRPTAIFAVSDALALGALKAAQALGIKVPEALSIVGFGETIKPDHMSQPLTTVRQPLSEMAFAAASLLIAPPGSPSAQSAFFGTLVPRATTGPAPG
jgi:LacI family transcriptional regulator